MRPSNRQRKYSWETEEEEPAPRRRPAEPPADFELEDPAPRTKAAARSVARRPGTDQGRVRKSKKKPARTGSMVLRAALFFIVVGGVGALAMSGLLTVGHESPEPSPLTETTEAGPQDAPKKDAVAAAPPDFGSTFADISDSPPAKAAEPAVAESQPEPVPTPVVESRPAPAKEIAPVASLEEPPATATRVPIAQPPIDPGEVIALRKRGEEMIRQGNIGQARLFLERAMRAEDPQATLLLAQTFDPDALARWGVLNMSTNPARAEELYQRARELGATIPPR